MILHVLRLKLLLALQNQISDQTEPGFLLDEIGAAFLNGSLEIDVNLVAVADDVVQRLELPIAFLLLEPELPLAVDNLPLNGVELLSLGFELSVALFEGSANGSEISVFGVDVSTVQGELVLTEESCLSLASRVLERLRSQRIGVRDDSVWVCLGYVSAP
ncbi:hypothetical protein RJT34_32821 [Clitoria ternatea]|uniref:Uncharacterized protein n=1 Tax=Clitoria ternatea TaxID=43366 RepID=A0AAN9EYT6_CLITE